MTFDVAGRCAVSHTARGFAAAKSRSGSEGTMEREERVPRSPLGIAVFTQHIRLRVAACMSVWLMLALASVGAQAASDPAAQVFALPSAERIYVEQFSPRVDLLEDP